MHELNNVRLLKARRENLLCRAGDILRDLRLVPLESLILFSE